MAYPGGTEVLRGRPMNKALFWAPHDIPSDAQDGGRATRCALFRGQPCIYTVKLFYLEGAQLLGFAGEDRDRPQWLGFASKEGHFGALLRSSDS